VSVAQYKEMIEIFALFDADRSGSIDPKEIRTQMLALGFKVDNTTIYQLISDLDSDGSQSIEFEEFAGLLTNDELGLYKTGVRQSYDEIFDFMDDLSKENRDAKIEISNLKRIANVIGDNISDAELAVMIKGADQDGKGYVDRQDFYELMVQTAERVMNTVDDSEDEDDDTPYTSERPISSAGSSGTASAKLGQTRSSVARSRKSVALMSQGPLQKQVNPFNL